MSPTSLSVWFVCKLCRGSFGQVDTFIEHKKQKHFTQFQNTTCIVFEERELGEQSPVIIKAENQPVNENNEPRIKIEASYEDQINPFSSEIIEEPNLSLLELKNEPVTYEIEIIPDYENSLVLKQPEQNPYVLLKRLTSEEIQRACVTQHQHHSSLSKCEQTFFTNTFEPPNSSDASSNSIDTNEVDKSAGIQPTANIINSTENGLKFDCKLCLKQLQSAAQLKLHVGICALYHKDRNRFCVICNKKLCKTATFKNHRLRFHGTEEEKSSLYKFKCRVCSKQFGDATYLSYHLEIHKKKKQKKVKASKSKPLKCSHPNCVTESRCNSALQIHISTVHSGVRPFSCDFPNCKKRFALRGDLERHFRIHTGERPYKCTIDNCGKAFTTSQHRSLHHQRLRCTL